MKKIYSKRFAYIVAMTGLAVLAAGCGSSNSGAVPPVGVGVGGLLGGSGGCIGLNVQGGNQMGIAFSAVNAYWDTLNFKAGIILVGIDAGSFGQTTVGSGGVTGGQFTAATQDGSSITLSIQANGPIQGGLGYNYGGTASPANAQGVVVLSQIQQNAIAYQWYSTYGSNTAYGGQQFIPTVAPGQYPQGQYPNGAYPYNGQYPQQYQQQQCISVTGIAIDTGFVGGNGLLGPEVYLYLNGTQHGVHLYL